MSWRVQGPPGASQRGYRQRTWESVFTGVEAGVPSVLQAHSLLANGKHKSQNRGKVGSLMLSVIRLLKGALCGWGGLAPHLAV